MKKLYQLRRHQSGPLTGITNAILAILLVAGLIQIALCFRASVGLLPRVDQAVSASQVSAYATNSPIAHDANAPKNERS
jgi:hypothetical protein